MTHPHNVRLDLARQLKELGVDAPSAFHWILSKRGVQLVYALSKKHKHQMMLVGVDMWPAYLASELGEMLPKGCTSEKDRVQGWIASMENTISMGTMPTEADARASLLIYLLTHSIIQVKDL